GPVVVLGVVVARPYNSDMTLLTEPTDTDHDGWRAALAEITRHAGSSAAVHDLDGSLPLDVLHEARDRGLTAALVPAELGGGGVTHAEMGDILRELARTDPAAAVTLSMHSHLVAFQVWRHHHGQDATPMLAKVVDGACL